MIQKIRFAIAYRLMRLAHLIQGEIDLDALGLRRLDEQLAEEYPMYTLYDVRYIMGLVSNDGTLARRILDEAVEAEITDVCEYARMRVFLVAVRTINS